MDNNSGFCNKRIWSGEDVSNVILWFKLYIYEGMELK